MMRSEPYPTSPRLEPGSVERTSLLARLAEGRNCTCLLILGPAGSGKTSLALQWRGQALTYGHDVAWVTAQPEDYGQTLMDRLFKSLDRIHLDLAREARLLFNRVRTSSSDSIAIALLRSLQTLGKPIVLVLDDWQNVVDEGVHRLVQMLLDYAPQALRVVIVSRSVPQLALARLRDQGALVEIGPNDLRFTLEEVRAFLQMRAPRHAQGEDARRMLELTAGWAAGLRMMTLQPLTPASPVQNAQDFAAYFNREVLTRLDEASLEAMTRLSVVREFNQALAAVVSDDELGPKLVERLSSEHLFVTPQGSEEREGWYRFHPLFRDLLLERFSQLPADVKGHTHSELARWFGRRRYLREAVHHGLQANDQEQAAGWVERWARELFLNGELQQLVRAVAELPRAVLNERPSLLLWLGWTQLCYHRVTACHETIAALRLQATEFDESARAHCALLEFSLALQEDDLISAQSLMPEMEAMRQGTDAVLIGGRRNLLGWMYAHKGEYEKARTALSGPVPLRDDGTALLDSPFGYLMNQSLIGLTWLDMGDVRHAEPILREALARSERALGRFSEPTCNAVAYLSAVLYEMNDLPGLRQLLDGRLDTVQRVGLPDALETVSLVAARLSRFDGNPREALECLERMEDVAKRRSLDRLIATSFSEKVRCLLQIGDIEGASVALGQLEEVAKRRQGGSSTAVSARVGGLLRYTRALLHAQKYENELALGALGEHGVDDASHTQRRDQCGSFVLRAMLLERIGRRDSALRIFTEALRIGRDNGLVRSILDMGEEALSLVDLVLKEDRSDEAILTFYIEHLREHEAKNRHCAAPARPDTYDPLSDREMEVLKALAQSMSNKRIAQALGVSPETVKFHLRNVYTKLSVAGRDAAVARSRDLGLLA